MAIKHDMKMVMHEIAEKTKGGFLMAMMAEKKDKVQEILEVVKTTRVINRENVAEIVKLQDLFNVNVVQAQQVMEQLDRYGKDKLFWIITTVAGYDTFEFWFKHGFAYPWADRVYLKVEKEVEEAYRERGEKLFAKEKELNQRAADLIQMRLEWQRELEKREADLRYREGVAVLKAEKQAGEKVRALRQQVERLQEELEKERALNRKAKRLARLVEKL